MSSSSGYHVDGWIVFKKHVWYTKKGTVWFTKLEEVIFITLSEVNALNAQRQILALRLHVSATPTLTDFYYVPGHVSTMKVID